nr:tryptophan 2,3-dioxygenase family protein [Candidatus Methylobacter favarea]
MYSRNYNSTPLYCSDYLNLNMLRNSQLAASGNYEQEAHDGMLFIITHQTYELWFKQILHELFSALELFSAIPLDEKSLQIIAVRLGRIIRRHQVITHQIANFETMTPLDFIDFCNYLIPASGFPSRQFREIELRLCLAHHSSNFSFELLTKRTAPMWKESLGKNRCMNGSMPGWPARRFWNSSTSVSGTVIAGRLKKCWRAMPKLLKNPILSDKGKNRQFAEHESIRQSFACLFDQGLYEQHREQGRF